MADETTTLSDDELVTERTRTGTPTITADTDSTDSDDTDTTDSDSGDSDSGDDADTIDAY